MLHQGISDSHSINFHVSMIQVTFEIYVRKTLLAQINIITLNIEAFCKHIKAPETKDNRTVITVLLIYNLYILLHRYGLTK